MVRPIDAKPITAPIPGKPNPEFTRRRPMTWNMPEESGNILHEVKKVRETTELTTNHVGFHSSTGKPAFIDEITKLFYIEDPRSPKNKHYIRKSSINFSKPQE
jgi:hypothetical protein